MTKRATNPNAFLQKLLKAPIETRFRIRDFEFVAEDVKKAQPTFAWKNTPRRAGNPVMMDECDGYAYLEADTPSRTTKMIQAIIPAMILTNEEGDNILMTEEKWETVKIHEEQYFGAHHAETGYDVRVHPGRKLSVGCQTHPLAWWTGEEGTSFITRRYAYYGDEDTLLSIVRRDLLAVVDAWPELQRRFK